MTRIFHYIFTVIFVLLGACAPAKSPSETHRTLQGYAEARLLYLAPRTSGPITALTVEEGDQVNADDPLFSLDDGTVQAQLDQTEAKLSAFGSRLADLMAGGRKEDIAAAVQIVSQARATLILAQENHTRSTALVTKGQAPQARLDRDNAALAEAKAVLGAQQARLALIRAPARKDAIQAAGEEMRAQKALVMQVRKALTDLAVLAPKAGSIEIVLRRVGEIAGPSQPVVALLPPEQIRIRFFVPEPDLGTIKIGDPVGLTCDGCDAGRTGRVIFIANTAEFTPPVIFTEKERGKLVYMAEVLPENPARFHPGQPVLVTLP